MTLKTVNRISIAVSWILPIVAVVLLVKWGMNYWQAMAIYFLGYMAAFNTHLIKRYTDGKAGQRKI